MLGVVGEVVVVIVGSCRFVVTVALFVSLLVLESVGIGPNCCSRCCTSSGSCMCWKGIDMS